jgi:hypothetical protein
MSFRTFLDSEGNEWQAFDVVPRVDERRNYDRRVSEREEDEVEERRDGDRRLTVGGSDAIIGQQGWLCFERGDQRRRLSPIPANWTRATDAELDAYRQAARPVRLTSVNSTRITERNS